MLRKCQQSKERFFSSFGPPLSIFQLRVSVVWLLGFTFTGPWSLLSTCLHLIHVFIGCVSHHIRLWLCCENAFASSPKNILGVALVRGNIRCILHLEEKWVLWLHIKKIWTQLVQIIGLVSFVLSVVRRLCKKTL